MASLRKIDGAWVLDWRDSQGRHRKTLGEVKVLSERDAKRILARKNLELSAGYQILVTPQAPMFQHFSQEYLRWHGSEFPHSHDRVRQIIEQHLMPTFGDLQLDAIKPKDAEDWKSDRLESEDEPKGSTVAKELRTLKAVLNRAVAWEVIRRNPLEHVSAPKMLDSKPPEFWLVPQLKSLYEKSNPTHAAMWKLFANTGMRRGEGQHLKRAWVGSESLRILSTEDERTKSGKWREIPLTDGAREALEGLPKADYVLPRMTPPSLSRECIRAATRAELSGGLHTLRHTYISHLVMAGVPLRTVQMLAGHSTIVVTERYAHLAPQHLQDAGRSINL